MHRRTSYAGRAFIDRHAAVVWPLRTSRLWRYALCVCALLFACTARAEFDHTHKTWNNLLQSNVVPLNANRATAVRYGELKDHGATHAFDWYLGSLSAVPTTTFNGWSRAERLAFLINAYNAYTIKLVLRDYPVSSVRDLGGASDDARKREFFSLLGSKRSLDELEHEIIGMFQDPRVLFALSGAAVGSPMLRNEAYVATRLDAQLNDQAKMFMSDATRNRYDARKKTLRASEIFSWYAKDFERAAGSVKAYLATYAPQLAGTPEARVAIGAQDFELDYLPYDWRLNDAR